ncbi:MAG: hemerythrin domain-containing protein [Pyrinomonadaceae bacterium]
MNAIKLLVSDHKTVDTLFEKAEKSSAHADKVAVFSKIKAELEAHAHVEESIFYPSLQEDGDKELVHLVFQAIQEHQQMKTFLGELSVASKEAGKFEPLLAKLIEDVRHHVKEEEGEMFPMVESQFDDKTVEKWGAQMKQEKDRFQSSTESAYN